jgi:hypothetical protein
MTWIRDTEGDSIDRAWTGEWVDWVGLLAECHDRRVWWMNASHHITSWLSDVAQDYATRQYYLVKASRSLDGMELVPEACSCGAA